MDFELTEAQREYRDRARSFAQEQLLPGYRDRERDGRIDPKLRCEIGTLGLIAPELPTELGGRGMDRLTAGLITEEIGRGDINVAYLQVVGSLVGQILAGNAVPEVAHEWVTRMQRRGDRRDRPHRAPCRVGCGHAGTHRRPRRRPLGARRGEVAVVRR